MIKGLLWLGAGRSCMVFANGTLKGREGNEKPGCPSLNRGCQLRKEGPCSCLFAGGCRQHENCLKISCKHRHRVMVSQGVVVSLCKNAQGLSGHPGPASHSWPVHNSIDTRTFRHVENTAKPSHLHVGHSDIGNAVEHNLKLKRNIWWLLPREPRSRKKIETWGGFLEGHSDGIP